MFSGTTTPRPSNFWCPIFAMSAGTILVMSGDDIYMDYYAVLGPIDPQVRNQNGTYVPSWAISKHTTADCQVRQGSANRC